MLKLSQLLPVSPTPVFGKACRSTETRCEINFSGAQQTNSAIEIGIV
jgi:hypothetical protein